MHINNLITRTLGAGKSQLLVLLALLCLPLTATAQIYLYASTKAEWKALAENSKYSNTEVYVTLTGDFTIDNDVDNWEDFKGTLDGNGHTITVDYKGIDRAPLRNTVGYSCVKNLRIEGTIENHLGLISYDWANPLARYVGNGTLKVTNCHSRVHYKIVDEGDYNSVGNGGFVGKIEDDGNAIFENCSYIGSIRTNKDI